ncbi:hypothetical protein BCR33DRAFT_20551 [Rhizoclosmatium globosum]|uniref:Uncharacterized protein n=1 Tax=Rhizoclosmatium globosum TaxID=329046 RepID=A0A1Y2CQ78_9FUNG|nr:hypothetical protein BCR33DRAFT_20551 [Rhizoclosmatium globosum]|eukprot:ORY49182.1 hypothetical protein BCR33DRAFT_20551 [Rhizoclosmatium globosum]
MSQQHIVRCVQCDKYFNSIGSDDENACAYHSTSWIEHGRERDQFNICLSNCGTEGCELLLLPSIELV